MVLIQAGSGKTEGIKDDVSLMYTRLSAGDRDWCALCTTVHNVMARCTGTRVSVQA